MRALALILALSASPAMAAPIFVDDFQDGQADGWAAGGAGDVRLTTYEGNVSMRLTARAMAQAAVSTVGFRGVSVAASLAALSLEKDDACIAETSADGGASWSEIVSVRDGADDGVTLRRGEAAAPGADDNARLLVRLRAAGGKRASCWGDAVTVTGDPIAATGAGLDAQVLLSGAGFDAPVDLSAFAPGSAAPFGRFEGRLVLELAAPMSLKVLVDETEDTDAERKARATLPPFDFAFVQDGPALIPARRGPVVSGHSEWDWVLEPGQVWQDGEWMRASLPFALQERNANCLHNGVLAFLFKADGTTSHAALEIASETCAYLKFDAWGMARARYAPGPVEGAEALVTAHRANLAARLPVRPISVLPGVDPSKLDLAATADGDPPSAYGLVVDGVRYAGPCRTRHGDYPFCEALDLPSYSTAKSIFGGVGLMRLEALRPGAAGELIADHVPACARPAWRGVTFAHALDMATGVYTSTAFEADENAPHMGVFFDANTHADKAAYACTRHARRAEPGTTFVYHTTDTYLLGAAMKDVLGADPYDGLVAPLWAGLTLSPAIQETRRTYDEARQPFVGWGLTYQADDIVRIAAWLDGGAGGLLDAGMLAAALQRDPANPGLSGGGPAYRYKAGFWARDIGPLLGCGGALWVPFMSGYGGISVVLLPGGVTYYYFGDSRVFDWAPAALEAARIKGMCP